MCYPCLRTPVTYVSGLYTYPSSRINVDFPAASYAASVAVACLTAHPALRWIPSFERMTGGASRRPSPWGGKIHKSPIQVMKKKVVTAIKDIYNRRKFMERGTV